MAEGTVLLQHKRRKFSTTDILDCTYEPELNKGVRHRARLTDGGGRVRLRRYGKVNGVTLTHSSTHPPFAVNAQGCPHR